jgi:nucleoside-diphosphate-sugar epimerase
VIRGALRSEAKAGEVNVGDIGPNTDWQKVLEGVDVVVHTAARAHIMIDTVGDPLSQYRKVNVEGALNLARQAAVAKVKRFIFISSIKVNGESTAAGKPFTPDDQPNPADPYGISKWEAELGLQQLAAATGMEVVIIRPPLLYGPGVKANFLSMMRWINDGVPLPLARIDNRRSLVAIDNLVDLIITCIDHPAAANQVFLAGDGDDLSTAELAKCIGKALGKPARLFPFPVSILSLAAGLLGKKSVVQRLTDSLQVDISRAGELLAWKPPVTLDQCLRKTADDFRRQSAGS